MDILVNRTLANQRTAPVYAAAIEQGYWCYNNSGCKDSSTTQFAAAGLQAARTFYQSPVSGDLPYLDAPKATLVAAALALTKQAYELNAKTGSDNASCNVLSATERGHGYNAQDYNPSLQQTASGIYIQLFGGSNVNTPMVQHYMEWIKNRYRYTDLDSMGNSLARPFLVVLHVEFVQGDGVDPAGGHRAQPRQHLGPDSYGTLPAASAPACVRAPGAQGSGDGGETGELRGRGRRFLLRPRSRASISTMRTEILSKQCYDGSLPITGTMAATSATAFKAPGRTSRIRRICCSSCSVRRATSSRRATSTATATSTRMTSR